MTTTYSRVWLPTYTACCVQVPYLNSIAVSPEPEISAPIAGNHSCWHLPRSPKWASISKAGDMRWILSVDQAASAFNAGSISENAEIAVAVFFAEFDYFLLDRRWICLGLAEDQPPRGRRIDAVRFHRKVMVIAHDKGH
jgi:hypothetical protein